MMSPRAFRRAGERERRREAKRKMRGFRVRLRGCNVPLGYRGAARLQAAQERRPLGPQIETRPRVAFRRSSPGRRAPRRRTTSARRRDGPADGGDPDPDQGRPLAARADAPALAGGGAAHA